MKKLLIGVAITSIIIIGGVASYYFKLFYL